MKSDYQTITEVQTDSQAEELFDISLEEEEFVVEFDLTQFHCNP